MAKRPPHRHAQDDPDAPSSPGAWPLTPPSAEAVRRAAPLFAQLVDLGPASAHSAGPDGVPERRYPLAARLLAGHLEQGDLVLAAHAVAPGAQGPSDGAAARATTALMPQGFVRASVAAGRAEAVPQVLLEDVAQMALVDAGSKLGPSSFVIVFREELLGELQCRLEVGPTGHITATFVAADAHTRRLLTHAAPRLRAKLTGQGLHDVQLTISDS
jgi:hypothetical protein